MRFLSFNSFSFPECFRIIFILDFIIRHRYTSLQGFPGTSAGKESSCNAGDPSSIPGLGRFPGEGIGYPHQYSWASLVAQLVKSPPCNVGDLGLIPGLARSPGEGKGYPLQYSSLENSMDCIVHGVSKSRTRLSDFHFHFSVSALMSPQRSNKSRITLNSPLLLPKLLGLLLNVEVEDRPMKGSLPQEMR